VRRVWTAIATALVCTLLMARHSGSASPRRDAGAKPAASAPLGDSTHDDATLGIAAATVDTTVAQDDGVCLLCAPTLPVPLVAISPTEIDSLARAFAALNEAQLTRIDSIFGSPALGTREARDAHLLARISTLNCYHLLDHYASDGTRIHVADENVLRDVFREYSDVGLFCIARLKSVRMGLGHVCLHYDLEEKTTGHTGMGGKVMAYRVKDTNIEGRKRRILSLDLPTGSNDVVEVLLAEHHAFEFDVVRSDDPSGPCEAYIVDHIRGGWLHKWGTHRPQAFMFWASSGGTALCAPPQNPKVGVRIYVPHLELELPLLPDIDFDDLREIELPQPILSMPYLRLHHHPAWLLTDSALGFQDWGGHGEVPPVLRQRFPNY